MICRMSWLFPTDQYIAELRHAVAGCENLLDIGCGADSPAKWLDVPFKVGVDRWEVALQRSRARGIHHAYIAADALDAPNLFPPQSFDLVLLSDLIEHLPKPDGEKLLSSVERLASKRVVVFTPNGFVAQDSVEGNPWQRHVSGWYPLDFRKRGYTVMGINGWRPLRKERAFFRWPAMLTSRLSKLSEPLVTPHPEHAYALLCVKQITAAEPIRPSPRPTFQSSPQK